VLFALSSSWSGCIVEGYECCKVLQGSSDCVQCADSSDIMGCLNNTDENELVLELHCEGNTDYGDNAPIPEEIGNLVNLEYLRIEEFVVGPLPASLFSLTKLTELYIGNNPFWVGEFPQTGWSNLISLTKVSFYKDTGLHGAIPIELNMETMGEKSIDVRYVTGSCIPQPENPNFVDKIRYRSKPRPCPLEPTPKPTQVPSPSPSTSPTTSPTGSPTTSPSTSPTSSPSRSPSTSPTYFGQPTSSPTPPTPMPTSSPSASPTTPAPTPPTASPTTGAPTAPTTASPSQHPTQSPTQSPTPTAMATRGYNPFCDGEFVPVPQYNGTFWATTALMSLASLVGVAGIVYVIYYRKRPIIEVALPGLTIVMFVALVMCNVGVWLYAFGLFTPSRTLCAANSWVISVSFATVLASLGFLLLSNGPRQALPARTSLIAIGCFSLVVVLILALWSAISPSEPDACQLYTCTSLDSHAASAYFFALLYLLIALGLGLCIGMLLLREKVIPIAMGFDGAVACTALFTVTLIVWVAVQYTLAGNSKADVAYLVLVIFTFITTTVFVFFLTIRKNKLLNASAAEIQSLYATAKPVNQKPDIQKLKSVGEPQFTPYATYNEEITPDVPVASQVPSTQHVQEHDHTRLTENYPFAPETLLNNIAEPAFLPPADAFASDTESEAHQVSQGVESEPESDDEEGVTIPVNEGTSVSEADELQTQGFKVGHEDGWDFYIHRESGDPFWIHRQTSQVRHEPPAK